MTTFLKRFFIVFLLVLAVRAESATTYTRTTVTIAFTNTIWGTSNYNTLTLNGDTRTFTNQVFVAATQISTNNTQSGSAANLFNHLSIYPFAGITNLYQSGSTNVVITGGNNQALTISVSSGWATLTAVTNTYTSGYPVVLPKDYYPLAQQTNLISLLYAWLSSQQATNANFLFSNKATGEWMLLTNNLLIISNAVSGRYGSLSNGVVTANSFVGPVTGAATSATTSTFVTGNNSALTNSINSTNNWTHYGNITTNDETHSYVVVTNDSTFGTNAATGELYALTNGFALLTAGVFLPTNSINSGVFTIGKNYETNISGNITLGAFAGVPLHPSNSWGFWIYVTNSSASDRTVTFPSGTKENGAAPAVFTVTNQQTADFFVYGWGNKKTNIAWYPHY